MAAVGRMDTFEIGALFFERRLPFLKSIIIVVASLALVQSL